MSVYRHIQKSIFPDAFPTSNIYKSICLTVAPSVREFEARAGNGQLNKPKNIVLSSILNLRPEGVRTLSQRS